METQLYVRIRGRVTGPYDKEKLQSLARRGQFSRIHEISRDGMNWLPASTCTELFAGEGDRAAFAGAGAPAQRPDTASVGGLSPDNPPAFPDGSWAYRHSRMLAISLAGIVALLLAVVAISLAYQVRNRRLIAQETAAAEKIAEEEKVATEKKIADERAAGENKAAGERAAAKRAAEGKAAASTRTAEIKAGADKEGPWLVSVRDHAGIENAIAKVVVGGTLTKYDGAQYECPVCAGSAFVITRDGAMLTNKHVIQEYLDLGHATELKRDFQRKWKLTLEERIWVFVKGEKFNARIEYVASKNDYAVLRVDHRFSKPFRLKLKADRTELLGADVRALGFPAAASIAFSDREEMLKEANAGKLHNDVAECFSDRDLTYTLTRGNISQVTEDSVTRATWLQHSAGIGHGSSGGPLVLAADATVVGVNTQGHRDDTGQGAEFYGALFLGQYHSDLDEHVPGVKWVP